MTITTQEWTSEPEPGDEHYQPSRVERLKQWLAFETDADTIE